MTVKCLSSNLPKYDHIIRWCLEDILQLNDYELTIQYCTLLNCSGRFLDPNNIQIDQNLDEVKIIRTLFHEIRHYYQKINQMFDFDFEKYTTEIKMKDNNEDDYTVFRDSDIENMIKTVLLEYYHSYLNFPWELDATKFSTETYGKYLATGKEDCRKHLWQGNYENYDNTG